MWDHFRIILRSPQPNNYVFQPNIHSLEMVHTNFVSSIRIAQLKILIRKKENRLLFHAQKHFLERGSGSSD